MYIYICENAILCYIIFLHLQTPKSHFLLRYNPIFAIAKAQMSVKNPIQVPLRSHPHPNHQILSRIPKHSTFDDTSAITQLCVAVLSKMLRGKAFRQHSAWEETWLQQPLRSPILRKKSGPILAEVKMEKPGPFQKATQIPTGK